MGHVQLFSFSAVLQYNFNVLGLMSLCAGVCIEMHFCHLAKNFDFVQGSFSHVHYFADLIDFDMS